MKAGWCVVIMYFLFQMDATWGISITRSILVSNWHESLIVIALFMVNLLLVKWRSANSKKLFFNLKAPCLGQEGFVFRTALPWLWDSWEPVLPAVTHCGIIQPSARGSHLRAEKHPTLQPFVIWKYIFGALVMALDSLQIDTELSQKQSFFPSKLAFYF